MHNTPTFPFDNTYARDLEGLYVSQRAAQVPDPTLLILNEALALDLGLDLAELRGEAGVDVLAGNKLPAGASPLAQAYAGHQFGGFSPQLGDGRALLLGEVLDRHGQRRDIQLKGSGPTAFSRRGDGKAAIGPVLREYLVAEAMHTLGVPTSRALAAVSTGEQIYRQTALPGAILTRVAASHIRVGTFQFFAAQEDVDKLRRLLHHTIARHDPCILPEPDEGRRALAFLQAVCTRQASLVARWMGLGFVHGVMNTDNTTVSGETIDYGPCAFMETYDPDTVFSSIDRNGRYAYDQQAPIMSWNLTRLAESLLPLMDHMDDPIAQVTEVLKGFADSYQQAWRTTMRAKLGLAQARDEDPALIDDLFQSIEGHGVDFTLFFRKLAQAAEGDSNPLRALFNDPQAPNAWLKRWTARLGQEDATPQEIAARVLRSNPLYIPRNHLVEEVLEAATQGNMEPFMTLHGVLQDPYTEREGLDHFATPAPKDFGHYVTFCGT